MLLKHTNSPWKKIGIQREIIQKLPQNVSNCSLRHVRPILKISTMYIFFCDVVKQYSFDVAKNETGKHIRTGYSSIWSKNTWSLNWCCNIRILFLGYQYFMQYMIFYSIGILFLSRINGHSIIHSGSYKPTPNVWKLLLHIHIISLKQITMRALCHGLKRQCLQFYSSVR